MFPPFISQVYNIKIGLERTQSADYDQFFNPIENDPEWVFDQDCENSLVIPKREHRFSLF